VECLFPYQGCVNHVNDGVTLWVIHVMACTGLEHDLMRCVLAPTILAMGVRSTLCSTVRFYRKLDQFLIVPGSPLKTKVQVVQVPGDSLNRNPVDLGASPHTSGYRFGFVLKVFRLSYTHSVELAVC